MNRQDMNHLTNRRNFLKQATLGAGALAGLPSLPPPALAADSESQSRSVRTSPTSKNSSNSYFRSQKKKP